MFPGVSELVQWVSSPEPRFWNVTTVLVSFKVFVHLGTLDLQRHNKETKQTWKYQNRTTVPRRLVSTIFI